MKYAAVVASLCLAAFALSLVGCGHTGPSGTLADEDGQTASVVVDEDSGSYRGVAIGDDGEAIQTALGKRAPAGENEPGLALGWEDRSDYGPTLIQLNRYGTRSSETWYRYRDVVLFLRNDKLGAFIVVNDDARSRRGVAVGMPLDRAQAAYPELQCGTVDEDADDVPYPACTGKVGATNYIWFGGDPIRSITVANVPLEGL
jgi:hypothetical protein